MPCSRLRELWDFIKKKYLETSGSHSRHSNPDEANYTMAVSMQLGRDWPRGCGYLAVAKLMRDLGNVDPCHTHVIQRFNVVIKTLHRLCHRYNVKR